MKTMTFISILVLVIKSLSSQNYYFPPLEGSEWKTVTPESLGWCTDEIDTLIEFLEVNNTKAFILLQDGKESFMLPVHRS